MQHWPKQGDWRFDETYWPDPDAMVKELQDMGIELMVSIWPTVDRKSENYDEMLEKGLLIRTDRGERIAMTFQGLTVHFDPTNPAARKYVWGKAKQNYYSKGIKVFWLDEAEPEYTVYDFDNYRYHMGSNVAIGNIFPREYSRAFYEGMIEEGQTGVGQSCAVCMGRQPKVRCSCMEWRHCFFLGQLPESAGGGTIHGNRWHPLVDNR
jgi:alpha-D-xyloside xylohydrolase